MASARLWRVNNGVSLALVLTQLSLIGVQFLGAATRLTDGSNIVIVISMTKLLALAIFILAIVMLFKMKPRDAKPANGRSPSVPVAPSVTWSFGTEAGEKMSVAEARRIVDEWAKHLEHSHDRLRAAFGGGIPESLLPVPLPRIEAALNIVAKRYHDHGDLEAAELLKSSFGPLFLYTKDIRALEGARGKYGMPEVKEVIVANMQRVQRDENTRRR